MPIVAVAVVFQILTQQYLHASFLLSGRNSFYLINTASIIRDVSAIRIGEQRRHHRRGVGTARGRRSGIFLRADAQPPRLSNSDAAWPIGTDDDRRIDHGADGDTIDASLRVSDLVACIVLVGAGLASYLAACWLFDISCARSRLKVCLALFRTKIENIGTGSAT